jgi:hypothetical protein
MRPIFSLDDVPLKFKEPFFPPYVQARMKKITTLEAKVAELEGRLAAGAESATAAAMEEQQAELEHLREGLTVLGAELEQMTEEKGRLEEEYQRFQAGLQSFFIFEWLDPDPDSEYGSTYFQFCRSVLEVLRHQNRRNRNFLP